ncbi:MAG: tryptophan synthase subunit alpha [Eubacteriaceae bacterium]|jgi:tryptophan synthase alpha chain|nr:tryptophan synthase subunit alpha [Eubacteriaceae bacterium]
MTKIANAFKNKKAFIGFLTAGDPSADKTVEYILAMEKAGCDLIEIGIPFSDPTAEGPVIQEANIRALSAGIKTDGVFDIVRRVREKTAVPLVFLTYMNPVFHYGYEEFFAKCEELGVDGIISPELPYEERGEMLPFAAKHNVDMITMVAPTSEERIKMIAREATGFVYIVSSMGVTGVRSDITTDLGSIVEHVRAVTDTPAAIGFGISTPGQAAEMAGIADGVIVGSAIVKIIEKYGSEAAPELEKYVRSMKAAVASAEEA